MNWFFLAPPGGNTRSPLLARRACAITLALAGALGALLILAAAPLHASTLPPAYEALVREGLRTHPELRALGGQAAAQRARIDRAGAFPDPMLMIEWSMLPLAYPVNLARTEMSGIEVGLQQELPFPGKRRLAREVERHGIDIIAARAADTTRAIRGAVAQAYYELAFVDEALRLLDRNARVLAQIADHAKLQVGAGKAFSVDVWRSQSEVAQVKERRYGLEARRIAAEVRINVLLGRGPTARLPATSALGAPPSLPPVDELTRLAETSRPSLHAKQAELRRAHADRTRAERERYPNFLVGASYRFRVGPQDDMARGSDFYSLRFGITLPVWGRQAAEARESHARASGVDAEVESERRRVFAEVHRLHAEWIQARRTLTLYGAEIRPVADQTLRASLPVYAVGRIDFHAVLQTWARVLETDLEQLRLLATLHAKLAELETAIGARIGPESAPTHNGAPR